MAEFLYSSLEQLLAEGIEQGRWKPGEKLPSIRALVLEAGLSKTTVMHALSRLEARGLIESRPKAGFFVRTLNNSVISPEPRLVLPVPVPVPMSVNAVTQDLMCRSAVFDILPEADRQETMPPGILQLNRTVARALRRQRGLQHQYYDEPAGSQSLRDVLVRRYKRQGCHIQSSDLTITAGCQQALFFALMSVCQQGDLVAVESPGFYGVLQLLEALGLKVLEIPSSTSAGMDMDILSQVAAQWPIKACVVTPSFATPSGAVMPVENRKRLLDLAAQHNFYVVEDDIYRELAFGHQMPPLQSLDTEGRVILCGSVSKTLSRDLRVGWVATRTKSKDIQRLKRVTALAGSRYVQNGVSEFMEDGGYDRHLRRYVHQLQIQRDELLNVIQTQWSLPCGYSVPQGGLALWLQLPQQIDTLQIYNKARERGILITPGALFTASEHYRNCLRMSYSHPWNSARRDALRTLGEILGEAI